MRRFERPEGMLNSPFTNPHHPWCLIQPALHFFQHCFMFPTPDSPLLTRRALRLQPATLAFRSPVTVNYQTLFYAGNRQTNASPAGQVYSFLTESETKASLFNRPPALALEVIGLGT